MGASGTERVALLFETRADVSGAQAVTKETTAIGTAANGAATESAKLSASIEQVREAQSRANGDFEKFKRELAGILTAQQQLGAAARQAGEELAKEAAAIERVAGTTQLGPAGLGPDRIGPQIGPNISPRFGSTSGGQQLGPAGLGPDRIGPQLGPALPGLSTAAAIEASNLALDKMNPKARQAGNALNMLAAAAASGNGSVAGLATAVGSAAQGITAMSSNAKIAASSAGIGALAAAIGLLIALAIDAKQKLKEIPEGKLGQAAADHLKNLRSEEQVQGEMTRLAERRVALESQLLKFGGLFGGNDALTNQKATLQAIVDLDAERAALTQRQIEVREEDRQRTLAGVVIETAAQTTAVGRYQAQLRQIEAERIQAIRTHELTEKDANRRAADQRHDLNKEGRDFLMELDAQTAAAEIAVTKEVFKDRRQAENERYAAEKRALQDRSLSTEAYKKALDDIEKKHEAITALINSERLLVEQMAFIELGLGSESLADNVAARLDQIEEERLARIRAGVSDVLATRIAEQEKRKLYNDTAKAVASSLASIMAITASSTNERTKALHNFIKNLRAIELGYEAVKATISALREGAESVAAAARGDFAGAALHGAAAIKFAGVAAVAANEAGGGGGAGGAGGGAAGGGTTFQPRDNEGGGAQIINLYTVDPYSREAISVVSYELGRADTLKRPINVPPTTALTGKAA